MSAPAVTARVRSVNLSPAQVGPGGHGPRTGIDKRPVGHIEVAAPPEGHGHGSGVLGDHVGSVRHHGGAQKAVYAFAREELDWWEHGLGRGLPDGMFGENLTTEGLDLEMLAINQRLRVGDDAILEVSVPRQPCATFASHLGERGWVRRFTEHGRCGVYLRVRAGGMVRVGDPIEVLAPPGHDIDMMTAFAAAMGDDVAAARVVAARCLPSPYHEQMARRLTLRR